MGISRLGWESMRGNTGKMGVSKVSQLLGNKIIVEIWKESMEQRVQKRRVIKLKYQGLKEINSVILISILEK